MMSFIQTFESNYPAMKNLVEQMSRVDLVRVSLQGPRVSNLLEAHGKRNISLFLLNAEETMQLSPFDKVELFVVEASQRRISSDEIPGVLRVAVSDFLGISIDDRNHLKVEICVVPLKYIDCFEGRRHKLIVGDHIVETAMEKSSDKLYAFFEDKWDGFTTMIDFFTQNLEMPIEVLTIDGSHRSNYLETLKKTVNFCSNKEIGRVNLGFSLPSLSDDHLKFLLENLSAKDEFCVHTKPSEDFEFHWKPSAPHIHIKHGHWFELDNLIEFGYKCKNINIENIKKISEAEAEAFQNEWADDKFPDLLSLFLESIELDYEKSAHMAGHMFYFSCSG